MKTYHIATLPGDGVGIETIAETLRVLKELQSVVGGFELDFQHYDIGVAHYLKAGEVLPEKVYEDCKAADAILLGAVGIPSEEVGLVTDKNGTEVSGQAMFKLRFGLDLFAGVRPIKRWPKVPSSLAGHEKIDFVLVRESTEGLYASYGGGILLKDQIAADLQIITREGCEKVFDFAFKLALSRKGRIGTGRIADGKKLVTCTQKSNVLRSFAFYREVFQGIAAKYAGRVNADYAFIDAITLWMQQTPENFDIIVAENAHGDILSDMAAAFVGGMGMAPSGDIGLEHAMFQPAHGTAPTIAGKGIVNPAASVLSGKMMLEWLGDRHSDGAMLKAAEVLDGSVYNTFDTGIRTVDIGGTASTSAWTNEVITQVKKAKV